MTEVVSGKWLCQHDKITVIHSSKCSAMQWPSSLPSSEMLDIPGGGGSRTGSGGVIFTLRWRKGCCLKWVLFPLLSDVGGQREIMYCTHQLTSHFTAKARAPVQRQHSSSASTMCVFYFFLIHLLSFGFEKKKKKQVGKKNKKHPI